MAAANSTANLDGLFEYDLHPWGDLIYSSKECLKMIGIGVGLAFPGEHGGPRGVLRTIDPRGFKCTVADCSYRGAGIFSASIIFPGREQQFGLSDWEPFAPGVQRKTMYWTDDFIGNADDLLAAGLVQDGYFPGLPGMRKTSITIPPNDLLGHNAKSITKAHGGKFYVKISIPKDLGSLRLEEGLRRDTEWKARMMALPRPPRIDGPLRAARSQSVNTRRSALRLVWSKPGFVPGFNSPPPGPFAR